MDTSTELSYPSGLESLTLQNSTRNIPLQKGEGFHTFDHRFGENPFITSSTVNLPGGLTAALEAGFNPGVSLGSKTRIEQIKGFEDRFGFYRGADGTLVAVVIDGVGEMYTSQSDRQVYTIDGEDRILGDIPGYLLAKTLSEAVRDYPLRFHTVEGVKGVIKEANIRYVNFLNQNDLDRYSNDSKELIGGCTFALLVVNPSGKVLLMSAGDAIAIAKNSEQVVGTNNQLPDTNNALEPIKQYLYDAFTGHGSKNPQKEARAVYNEMFKRLQRNTFTNVARAIIDLPRIEKVLTDYVNTLDYLDSQGRSEICREVMERLPPSVKGYGFFDGNPNMIDHIDIVELSKSQSKSATIVLCTDGAFDSGSSNHNQVKISILSDYENSGVTGLLVKNQKSHSGPEATAIALRLF